MILKEFSLFMKIVCKIGSNVLLCNTQALDLELMQNLIKEISKLHNQGHQIIIITSGAVASGREIMQSNDLSRAGSAALGQAKLTEKSVEIFADDISHQILNLLKYPHLQKAKKTDFGREFLSLKMAVKTVRDIDEAFAHISRYSTKHSEAIVTKNRQNAQRFLQTVDAACVYHNTSTRFTDGSQFGLGGEIGISTQKLHARGPMSAMEMTTYKWVIEGSGQVRDDR
jgi:gamma-glutamyl phosphate reductase